MVNKKQCSYLKIVREFLQKENIHILYSVTILYNFIVIYTSRNKMKIYDLKEL